jgi:hypothetical protein
MVSVAIRRLLILTSTFSWLLACQSANQPPEIVDESMTALQPQLTVPTDRILSGEWRVDNGQRICDGYLSRVEDEDFCVAEVPDDWEPFEYEGQTYYVQPLADKNGQ